MFTNMKMYYKLIVALSLTALTVLAASSPALAGGQHTKDEAKRAVSIAVKTRAVMTQEINSNTALKAELAQSGQCVSEAIKGIPDDLERKEFFSFYIYNILDAYGKTYRATTEASQQSASVLLKAAGLTKNKTLKMGLQGKAAILTAARQMPESDTCAVTQAWVDNGYKGMPALVREAVDPDAYASTKRVFTLAGNKVTKAERLIEKKLSNRAAIQFSYWTQDRAIAIWASNR